MSFNISLLIPSSLRQGLFFGLNSGVLTTLGVICGLVQADISKYILIISVLSLAIADSTSEAYGLYVSKKAEIVDDHSNNPLISSISLYVMKFIIVASFLLPLLFTNNLWLYKSMIWPITWGTILLLFLDFNLSTIRKENILNYLVPHVVLVFLIVVSTKYFGRRINKLSK